MIGILMLEVEDELLLVVVGRGVFDEIEEVRTEEREGRQLLLGMDFGVGEGMFEVGEGRL